MPHQLCLKNPFVEGGSIYHGMLKLYQNNPDAIVKNYIFSIATGLHTHCSECHPPPADTYNQRGFGAPPFQGFGEGRWLEKICVRLALDI